MKQTYTHIHTKKHSSNMSLPFCNGETFTKTPDSLTANLKQLVLNFFDKARVTLSSCKFKTFVNCMKRVDVSGAKPSDSLMLEIKALFQDSPTLAQQFRDCFRKDQYCAQRYSSCEVVFDDDVEHIETSELVDQCVDDLEATECLLRNQQRILMEQQHTYSSSKRRRIRRYIAKLYHKRDLLENNKLRAQIAHQIAALIPELIPTRRKRIRRRIRAFNQRLYALEKTMTKENTAASDAAAVSVISRTKSPPPFLPSTISNRIRLDPNIWKSIQQKCVSLNHQKQLEQEKKHTC